jgi:hypothetical protein
VLLVVVRFAPNDRSENHDSYLALPDEASEFTPRTKTGDLTGIRPLRSDQQDIVQAVAMESPDGREIRGQRFTVVLLQGSNELLGCAVRDFFDLF